MGFTPKEMNRSHEVGIFLPVPEPVIFRSLGSLVVLAEVMHHQKVEALFLTALRLSVVQFLSAVFASIAE